MIIASILPESKKELLKIKYQEYLPPHLEIRLDVIGPLDILDIVSSLSAKKIATCRRREDGGIFKGSEAQRLLVLEKAIQSGHFDLVDVEMGTEAINLMERYKNQKYIVSYNVFIRRE